MVDKGPAGTPSVDVLAEECYQRLITAIAEYVEQTADDPCCTLFVCCSCQEFDVVSLYQGDRERFYDLIDLLKAKYGVTDRDIVEFAEMWKNSPRRMGDEWVDELVAWASLP